MFAQKQTFPTSLRRLSLLCLVAVGSTSSFSAQNANARNAELTALLDRVWDFELNEAPLLATDVGDPRGQDRLADVSMAAIERRANMRKQFLRQLEGIDPESLSDLQQIDHELLRLRLQKQISDHRFKTHLMPINNREGFHISFPELPRLMNPKTKTDFDNYVARLNDFGRYVDQHVELLRDVGPPVVGTTGSVGAEDIKADSLFAF